MSYKRITKMKSTPKNTKIVYNGNGFVIFEKELIETLLEEHNRLWELENKIENGTLIELPCKVGQEVWEVSPFSIVAQKITAPNIYTIFRWEEDEAFGRWIFLTKAEAEKKLKELQKDDV